MEFSMTLDALNAENPLYLYGLASTAITFYFLLIVACSGSRESKVSTVDELRPLQELIETLA
jgi:hypothetical protein